MNEQPWVVGDVGETSADVVPPLVVDAAKQAFASRVADTEVLPVVFDSLLGERRSDTVGLRRLRFGTGEPSIEVDVDAVDGLLQVAIALAPAGRASLTARHGKGTELASTDDAGVARIGGISTGPFSLTTEWEDSGYNTETAWVTL